MSEVTRGYWAAVVCNADFICVDTWSGYRGGTDRDPKGKQHLLSSDACDLALGEAVLDALAHSRWVLPAPREGVTFPEGVEFDMAVCDFKVNYPAWVNALMEICGYKKQTGIVQKYEKGESREQKRRADVDPHAPCKTGSMGRCCRRGNCANSCHKHP